MNNLPYPLNHESAASTPYHIVPDPARGGWNVYDTSQPQEPQKHFDQKEDAITYAREQAAQRGVGYMASESEGPAVNRPDLPSA